MKFRSLFVAFAAILIAPALAIAEPPTGKGNDKEPQPQILVVRDANNTFMGELLLVEHQAYGQAENIQFVFRGDVGQAAYFEANPLVVLSLSRPSHTRPGGFRIPEGHPVLFTGTDCTGTPYMSVSTDGEPRAFNLPVLPVEEVINGQVLYVPVDPALPRETITTFSSLRGNPPYSCSSSSIGNQHSDLTQMTEVYLNFQPPYTIGY